VVQTGAGLGKCLFTLSQFESLAFEFILSSFQFMANFLDRGILDLLGFLARSLPEQPRRIATLTGTPSASLPAARFAVPETPPASRDPSDLNQLSIIGLTVFGEPFPSFCRMRSIVGRKPSCISASAAAQTSCSCVPRRAFVNSMISDPRTFQFPTALPSHLLPSISVNIVS
jgi:hypothetical protein